MFNTKRVIQQKRASVIKKKLLKKHFLNDLRNVTAAQSKTSPNTENTTTLIKGNNA